MDAEGDLIVNGFKVSLEQNQQKHTEQNSQTELFLYRSSLNLNSLQNIYKSFNELVTLTIIGQPELHSLSGIENIPNLKELWAAECSIQETSALSKCSQLVKLYLYSNKILRIPNLTACKGTLQILWLAGNQISCIEHMEGLYALQELNLGNNNIYQIGNNLQCNKNLTTLNLSGNLIHSIKDLCQLRSLESLNTLQFADLMYGECPLVQLCNYRLYAIYHILGLQELDQFPVGNGERQLVDDFFRTKTAYYNNRYQQLLNEFYNKTDEKDKENREITEQFRESLYIYNLKEIERQQEPEASKEISNEHIRTKLSHLPLKMKKWENYLIEWKKIHQNNFKIKEYQLNCELETAGNITFSEVTNDELNIACKTLLEDCICTNTRRKYGIKGITIHKIIEIRNKGLELLCKSFNTNKMKNMRTMIMLLHIPDDSNNETARLFKICEKGFVSMKEFTLEITDCLYFNDSSWLKQISKKKSLLCALMPEHKQQKLCLIVKLPSQAMLKRIKRMKPKEDQDSDISNSAMQEGRACNLYQVSNPHVVLPVCLVEYDYLIENALETFKKKMGWTCDIHAAELTPASLAAYPVLNEISLTKILPPQTNVNTLTELTLKGCGLKSIGIFMEYPNITSLNVSCNCFTTISEFKPFPNLKHLDISFNSIYTLDINEDLPKLETLNISWNHLHKFMECLSCLQRHVATLQNLDITHNPFDIIEKDHMLHLIHQQFPKLEIINGLKIAKSFLKNVKILDLENEEVLLKGKSIPSNLKFETPQLKWKAEICNKQWQEAQDDVSFSTADNYMKWIYLTGLHITDVKSPKKLNRTLWADFSCNLLSNGNFLANGLLLQELSISHNIIQELGSWMNNLRNLVKLNLSCNYITSLKAFYGASYPSLKVLNVSRNWIKNLMGIENCEMLEECYASHNSITHLDDLHGVQNCKTLKVIDLLQNPIERNKDLYKYVTFHLPKLEVLSGAYIQTSDLSDTSELIGGCLDEDYFLRYHSNGDHRNMTELTLTNCQIKKVNLQGDLLPNLLSLNMEYNKISSLWNFRTFPSLIMLRLSHNHITQMKQASDPEDEKKSKLFFPQLKTLFLDNNNIINLNSMHLNKLKKLETLFLNDNELMGTANLQDIKTLQYLVLDRNKLECAYPEDFFKLIFLKELYVEGNKIQYLQFLRQMKTLRRLFIGKNEISDPEELRHLKPLKNLCEVGLLGNPMCHKINYFLTIHLYIPNVTIIDGVSTDQPIKSQ